MPPPFLFQHMVVEIKFVKKIPNVLGTAIQFIKIPDKFLEPYPLSSLG